MKKSIIQIITAGVIGLASYSCSDDFTELTPKGSASYETFWSNEQDATEAVNSMYRYLPDDFGRGYFWYINASDDMITGRVKAGPDNIKNFNPSGDENYMNSLYPNGYSVIRRANEVLTNVPEIDMDENIKNHLLGEAYFMRAFYYFWLAHTYGDNGTSGGIPIVTEENMTQEAGTFTRPESVIENYQQIIADLENAAALLPLFTDMESENYGRPHKDAAYAYMAKTHLYWAQYDNSKYTDVVTACDAVTNSGSGRALIDTGNPDRDFRTLHSAENNWASEYIWSVNSSVTNNAGSILPGCMLENKGWGSYNGWGYYQPTESLYQEFEEEDPRREVTILKYGDEFEYFGETRHFQSENSLSGFQFNKYMVEYGFSNPVGSYINTNGDFPSTTYNVPLMRYAEVLLMKSEALIMLGNNGDAPLNQVRDRAGLPPVSGATMEDLKHERRVELAGEFANRHFDLVRWGNAREVYSQPLYGRIHTDRSDPFSDYTLEVVWPARNFDPSYMNVWPIPNTVIQSSGITPNTGW
ncbi:RagB/SusD family nutrient uptake outer membrane protein [Sinomicrobium sp. M5D2P17]